MIVRKTLSDPESRTGIQLKGWLETDANGDASLAITTGKDYSAGIFPTASVLVDDATNVAYSVNIKSITHTDGITTIVFNVVKVEDDSGFSIDAVDGAKIFYDVWIDMQDQLPTSFIAVDIDEIQQY